MYGIANEQKDKNALGVFLYVYIFMLFTFLLTS